MQENADDLVDPSRSSQEDSPSVFPHSFKLRKRLEKLAQWRIDPSLIEFPADVREFRGGFATVSQGRLVSSSRADGGAIQSKHFTGEHPSSVDKEGLQSDKATQEAGTESEGKNEEAAARKVDSGNDHPREEGPREADNDKEHESPRQTSITKIGSETSISHRIVNADPDPGDHDHQSLSLTKDNENDQQGEVEGPVSRIPEGTNNEAKEQAKNESKNSKDQQDRDDETYKQRIVAVKKLNIENDTDLERVLGLALREAEFLVKLSNPNVVKLEGFVEELTEYRVWLIFPWQQHGNLRDFLATGEWEIPERISLINDVTLGVEYLHSQKPPIYHGDLKSLNILVNSECCALITDFGSARHLEDERASMEQKEKDDKPRPPTHPTTGEQPITLEALFSATASTLTLAGSSYTLRWAAPELLQDDGPRLRSDIWALGWIAYEVMTNTIPFHDIKKDAIVINRVIQGQLPSVTEDARMSLIRALCSWMVQCWSIDPQKRPTAEECRKLISWMPMIIPAPSQILNEEASRLRHARLMNQLGTMYQDQADYLNAFRCFTEALNIYTNHRDNDGRGQTLLRLADVYRFRSEYAEAVTFYSQALQILTELADESGRGMALFGLATTRLLCHEYDEASRLYAECLQIHTSTGSKRERATALWGLAEVHRYQAQYKEAISLYSEARQIYTEVGDRRERALALCGLASVHQLQEEYSEAVNLYSEALQIYTDVGDRKERAMTLCDLAILHQIQEEYIEATNLFSEALQIYTDIGDRQETASTLWNLASVHGLQKGYNEAISLYLEALQIYTGTGDRRGRAATLWGRAEVHRASEEYDEATQLYSEALQIFIDISDKPWRAKTLMSFAATNQVQGHLADAISLYTEASEVLEEMGDFSRAAGASQSAADIRKTLQDAVERYSRARVIVE